METASETDALTNLLRQAFYTPIELAAILRMSRLSVYKKLESGDLPGKKVDGRWKTSRAELYGYLKEKYGPQPDSAGAS